MAAKAATRRPARGTSVAVAEYQLRLYIAGHSARSIAAISNLQRICTDHLGGRYTIEVIDLLDKPHLAKADNILALPTLVRALPQPIRRIVGDLSNVERVLIGLDVIAVTSPGAE